MGDVAFRPSYQGWKPEKGGDHDMALLVLSDLPIRDGNSTGLIFFGSAFALSDLPIRDGNAKGDRVIVQGKITFQTFLSGMETRFPRHPDRPARGLSDLPIRDGNSLK